MMGAGRVKGGPERLSVSGLEKGETQDPAKENGRWSEAICRKSLSEATALLLRG